MAAVFAVSILGLFGALAITPDADAAKPDRCSPWPECRDDSEPPPDPTQCNDTFPAFSYLQEATRKAPAEIYLSSSEGCRSERVAVVSDMRQRIYITDDIFDPQGSDWEAELRVNVDMGEALPLSQWVFSGPELVWAVGPKPSGEQGLGGIRGGKPRPDSDRYVPPSDELIPVSWSDYFGPNPTFFGLFVSAVRFSGGLAGGFEYKNKDIE